MRLGEVFERFIQQAPISVMFRTLLEHAFDPAEIDRLFEQNATRQYTREVLFSSMVELMGAVVCGAQPSVRAASLASLGEIAASLTALYEKLKGLEPGVCRAFVLDNAGRLAPLVRQLDATLPQPVPGYRAKILDGNHLAGTEHRVPATRTTPRRGLAGAVAGGPRPGHHAGHRYRPVRGRPCPGAVPDRPGAAGGRAR